MLPVRGTYVARAQRARALSCTSEGAVYRESDTQGDAWPLNCGDTGQLGPRWNACSAVVARRSDLRVPYSGSRYRYLLPVKSFSAGCQLRHDRRRPPLVWMVPSSSRVHLISSATTRSVGMTARAWVTSLAVSSTASAVPVDPLTSMCSSSAPLDREHVVRLDCADVGDGVAEFRVVAHDEVNRVYLDRRSQYGISDASGVRTCPTGRGPRFVTDEGEESVTPLDWQTKAHNLVRILSVFLPQDADRDAVIYACCDGPISEKLARGRTRSGPRDTGTGPARPHRARPPGSQAPREARHRYDPVASGCQ
jgi:hypothetical protein